MWYTITKDCLLVLIAFIIVLIDLTNAFECGKRKNNINKVIVNGQNTSPGDWPWHAAIYHQKYAFLEYACGGTLLSKIFVLTADHCVRGENEYVLSSRNIFVRLGLHNMRDLNPKTLQQHKVQEIHTFGFSKQLKNDIAILELATEAEFTDYVQPACVNQVEDLTHQIGTAVGWGLDETNRLSQVLKSQRMPVIRFSECLESNDGIFRQALDSSLFCAGFTNGTTVCNGDSGGGLHFERNGTWYVGGIISFTAPRDSCNRCHLKSYAGFTAVQRFLPWIWNVTNLRYLDANAENPNKRIDFIKPEEKINLLPEDCGKYLVNRITGGAQTAKYEFTWIARLLMTNDKKDAVYDTCHGSIINQRYILLAASCFTLEMLKPIAVRLGDYDYNQTKYCTVFNETECSLPLPQLYGVESIIVHPEFNSVSGRNNIALIRVSRNIKFREHIQPICLPVTPSLRTQRPQKGIIAGWGTTEKNLTATTDVLLKATVEVLPQLECEEIIPLFYTGEDAICAGGFGVPNSCFGDDGIPLGYPAMYNGRIRFVQYGIASVFSCGTSPALYSYVPSYMDWILTNLKP